MRGHRAGAPVLHCIIYARLCDLTDFPEELLIESSARWSDDPTYLEIYKMKIFILLTASFLAAMSFGGDVVKVHKLTVEESLAAIEVINVTAEKVIDKSTLVDVDEEVTAVLEDAKEAAVEGD